MRADTTSSSMLTLRALVFVCGVTLTAGCDPEAGAVAAAAADADDDSDVIDVADSLVAGTQPAAGEDLPVCPADHVLAVKTTTGACHTAIAGKGGTWTGGSLLADLVSDDKPPPGVLNQLCEYHWQSPTSAAPDKGAFVGKPYTGVQSDCHVVWPQGELFDDQLRGPLRDAFYRHLGRLDAGQLPIAPRGAVRVALADTASSAPVEMNSDHAESMWRIIRAIACPGNAPCPVEVTRHLALPLLENGELDVVHGGFHGSRSHLARAIFAAVQSWRDANDGSGLVVNLSLGWRPADFGGLESPANMPAPARAVYQTILYGLCNRALFVTAAGNLAGDECDDKALAPAIWENHLGPDNCSALFGADVDPPVDIASQPMVHAVGGLDHNNLELPNARPNARSRLAAPAFMASADSPTGPTTPLTGSSVSAAVVSGIAGLVWSYHRSLTPGQVIARIYNKATSLGVQADFGVGGTVRRVSACGALVNQCSGPTCPTIPCPSTVVDTAALTAAAEAAVAGAEQDQLIDTTDATDLDVSVECPAMCGTVELFTRNVTQDACANDHVAGENRLTDPQPDWPTCSICFLFADRLYMELDEEVASQDLSNVSLEVSDGATIERLVLGAPELKDGRVAEIDVKPERVASALRATLHITFVDGETHSNAIAVLQ